MALGDLVLEHAMSLGQKSGKPIEGSILEASAVALTCRGARRILVPAPNAEIRAEVGQAIERLKNFSRKDVIIIDATGSDLRRTVSFLRPLRQMATKWPETAFVDFALPALYKMQLGTRHRAHIADDDVVVAREFLDIVDFGVWKGEERRLVELVRLLLGYSPVHASMASGRIEAAQQNHLADWNNLLVSDEFNQVLAANGKLGLIRRPEVVLAQVGTAFKRLRGSQTGRTLLQTGNVAVQAGTAVASGGLASVDVRSFLPRQSTANFAPAFEPLGSVRLSIARQALLAANPKAKPFPRSEYALRGLGGHSWLAKGEFWRIRDPTSAQTEKKAREVQKLRVATERKILEML